MGSRRQGGSTRPQDDRDVVLYVRFPRSLHKRLKLHAVDVDRTMAAIVPEAVERWLKAEEKS